MKHHSALKLWATGKQAEALARRSCQVAGKHVDGSGNEVWGKLEALRIPKCIHESGQSEPLEACASK
eukprot:461894-Amphidinium_carterae.1